MNITIELLKQKIGKVPDTGNERSYYPALCNFLEEYGKTTFKLRALQAISEESLKKDDKHVGFPDITVRNGEALIGSIEVKMPDEDLKAEKFKIQFSKYKDSLENIVFTNLCEWQLWQWTKDEGENKFEPKQTARVNFNITKPDGANSTDFENFLAKFFEGRAHETRTPKQLALALAKKTRLLSKQVEEALDEHGDESDLAKLRATFEKTLIQDISPHQFANMVAETMAYSLFLAALEHSHRGNGAELTLTNAIDYLPTNVPILADLYSLIKKVASTIPNITDAARLLVDQLNASDIERIRQKLVKHKPGEDPVIQFYEPFLKEYDPKEREARGVYYTPKPVVDYIVKTVDFLLREKFGKQKGLADDSVHLLDPATGTGTFLMSAIQQIYSNTKKQNETQGEEMVQRVFNEIVLAHILKHFYGFELLIAPYAVAHLKLTLEVERLGFNFALTKVDDDEDNDRFKIYLANTLDNPYSEPLQARASTDFGSVAFPSIPEESKAARKVKKDAPILAIVGNPPYSNFGRMNRGKWIMDLLKDYKQGLKEKKINLDDDFIKFIRFGQWKLSETKQGIFAMITSNTFIDGVTHRQMRRSLMDTFDEVYIYNLHGNSRKGETAPDGRKDENVFDIQQGVSINIFVKYPNKKKDIYVKYCDLWGQRDEKFSILMDENFEKTKWITLKPEEPNWFFVVKDIDSQSEYLTYSSVTDIFDTFGSGVKTERDSITIHFDRSSLEQTLDDFANLSEDHIRHKYQLTKDSRDWTISKAKDDVIKHNVSHKLIHKIFYRPFDDRCIWYSGKSRGFIGTPGYQITQNMFKKNIGFVYTRLNRQASLGYFFITKSLVDIHLLDTAKDSLVFSPLYIYSDLPQRNLLEKEDRKANFSSDFIKRISQILKYEYVNDGRGDLKKTLGPEGVFYYIYAMCHSLGYRSRYSEQLKIDYPRLPLTSDKKLFEKLVAFGNELVNLHLLGENPFDDSKTIFTEPGKWSVKIGGKKLDNLDDWKVTEVRYDEKEQRVYVNKGQYFEGVAKDVWEFMIGGYQVCEKWLKERKKAERTLSTDDLKHYMKIIVSIRETIRIMKEIDQTIPNWPIA